MAEHGPMPQSSGSASDPSGSQSTRGSSLRLASLDGLRGIAALVVLLYHLFLVAEPHLEQWLGPGFAAPLSFRWWLFSSPLSFIIAGPQAVLVFFLLSGIVLTLPVLRAPRYDWLAYYPRRIIRLYVPVFASVLLAVVLLLLVKRTLTPIPGWQGANARELNPIEALGEALLVAPDPRVNGPLWSLTWELAFSLLLPIYVLIARRSPRWSGALVLLSLVLIAVGTEMAWRWLECLPVFLIGSIAAVHLDRLGSVAQRINRSSRHSLWWTLTFAASILLITGAGFTASIGLQKPFTAITHLLGALVVVGGMGIVFLSIGSRAAQVVLGSRPAQWLGRVSFSLYLIHVPIVVTLAYAIGWSRWWLALVIGIAVSLIGAEAFTRLIEQPAHRLSRRVGRWVSGRRGIAETPEAPLNDGLRTVPSEQG